MSQFKNNIQNSANKLTTDNLASAGNVTITHTLESALAFTADSTAIFNNGFTGTVTTGTTNTNTVILTTGTGVDKGTTFKAVILASTGNFSVNNIYERTTINGAYATINTNALNSVLVFTADSTEILKEILKEEDSIEVAKFDNLVEITGNHS